MKTNSIRLGLLSMSIAVAGCAHEKTAPGPSDQSDAALQERIVGVWDSSVDVPGGTSSGTTVYTKDNEATVDMQTTVYGESEKIQVRGTYRIENGQLVYRPTQGAGDLGLNDREVRFDIIRIDDEELVVRDPDGVITIERRLSN